MYTVQVQLHPQLAHLMLRICHLSACISYRVFRARREARRYPSLASPNLLSALAILVESAALHTAWNAVFLASFQRANPFQFTAIDLWSPIAGIAFMLINLRVALGWAQRVHWIPNSGAIDAVSGRPMSENWKRTSYGFAPDSPFAPAGPSGPTTIYTTPPQRTRQSARLSYASDWGSSQRTERMSYASANPWQDEPWVIHAGQHPYALAANDGAVEVGVGAPRPLTVNVTRVVDTTVDDDKSDWGIGEAV